MPDILEVNPLFERMSPEDLSQRYNRTLIRYNGRTVYCCGFMGGREQKVISYHTEARIGDPQRGESFKEEVFNWRHLEVCRPISGWYQNLYDAYSRPFLLGYMIKRQWARGISLNNTFMVDLARNGADNMRRANSPTWEGVDSAFTALYNERDRVLRNVSITPDTQSVVLRRNMALIRPKMGTPRWIVYVMSFPIASVEYREGIWVTSWQRAFKAELCEAIPNWMQIASDLGEIKEEF